MNDLDIAIDELLRKIESDYIERRQTCVLCVGNEKVEIKFNEVIYLQSIKHYLLIKNARVPDGQVRCKISEAEKQLEKYHFIRVQNSVIVNCRFIEKINGKKSILMQNGEIINISRNRGESVRLSYQRYMREI